MYVINILPYGIHIMADAEAATGVVLQEKVFLKFCKIHMKTLVTQSLFKIKLQADSGAGVFLCILQNF